MSPPAALPVAFFVRPLHQVTRDLLGRLLVRRVGEELLVGRIVEVEAYAGLLDPASHSYRGPTARCRTMFGPAGRSYVYLSYGSHYCVNVTAGEAGLAAAVLLRAVEPVAGIETLRRQRAAVTPSPRRAEAICAGLADRVLCDGPGKLAAAFGIDRGLDGAPLDGSGSLWIATGERARRAAWTPRIGLGANPAASWAWRCIDADSTGVTRTLTATRRASRPSPSVAALRRSAGR